MYLVDCLLTLLVFLGLLLHLLSLLYLIDELEQVPQVQDHRLSLGRQGHIIHTPINTQTHTIHTQSISKNSRMVTKAAFCSYVAIDVD